MTGPIFSLQFVHHAIVTELRSFEATARAAKTAADIAALAEPLAFFAELMRFHHAGEEAAVFPLLDADDPNLSSTYLYDHAHETKALASLQEMANTARAGQDVSIAGFQRQIHGLVDAGIVHIEKENSLVLPWLANKFSPPQQGEIVGKVIAAIPKEKMPPLVPWIITRLSAADAEAYVRGLMAGMPAPVFEAAKGWIEGGVSAQTWTTLRAQIPELG